MLLMGGVFPPDIRVAKEADVLLGGGHDVFLLASDKDGRPVEENIGGLEVRRYPARAGRLESKRSALVTYATWVSPLWEREIDRFVEHNGLQALHVHDLPAVASALRVAERHKIPVVFDMHENYPAAVEFWPRGLGARLLQTPARYRSYERDAVRAADRVVTVVDESRQRVIGLGADPLRVIVFTNVDDAEAAPKWAPAGGAFTVAYAGGFGPHRGIDSLVRAMVSVRESVPGARLVLMGAGEGESALKALAEELLPPQAVEFTGWIGLDEMRRRLASAHVGVVPHLANEHTSSTVPHKLFQYMAMGLPIVVTDCAPLARIVRETGAGRVAHAGDPQSLAREIIALADPGSAKKASQAGLRAVLERYNLKFEGERLLELYAGLEDEGGEARRA